MTPLEPYLVAPTGGTPPSEPLDVETLKQLARLDRSDEDNLLAGFIAAARQQVERDTDLVLASQSWTLAYADGPVTGQSLLVPLSPIRGVTDITVVAADNTLQALPPGSWIVSATVNGTIEIRPHPLAAPWPAAEVGARWVVSADGGWPDGTLPPLLTHAVGLLATHYATYGRDLAVVGTIAADMPMGYLDAIQPFRRIHLI